MKETNIALRLPANLKAEITENVINITGAEKVTFEAQLSINGKKVDQKDFKVTNNKKLLLM